MVLGFPSGSAGKESVCNVGDLGSTPGLGRSPGEGNGYPLQYSGPENSMDSIVHGVTKSQTQLSNFYFQTKEKRRRKNQKTEGRNTMEFQNESEEKPKDDNAAGMKSNASRLELRS